MITLLADINDQDTFVNIDLRRSKTNAFLTGGFKGKVLDWNNDGALDLNFLQSPSTAEGEVDSNFDGIADVPGMSVCNRPFRGL